MERAAWASKMCFFEMAFAGAYIFFKEEGMSLINVTYRKCGISFLSVPPDTEDGHFIFSGLHLYDEGVLSLYLILLVKHAFALL